MQDESGLFFSAQDADTEGEEGKYYLLPRRKFSSCWERRKASGFCEIYDIRAQGNFAGANIPNLLRNKGTEYGMEEALSRVYQYRRKRMPLAVDRKMLTSWNAMLAAAYAMAARIIPQSGYLQRAETISFLYCAATG